MDLYETWEPVNQDFEYTGRRFDDESETQESRARQLDLLTGRWLQMDPTGMPDGPNRYLYCQNAPTIFSDMLGHESMSKDKCEELLKKTLKRSVISTFIEFLKESFPDFLVNIGLNISCDCCDDNTEGIPETNAIGYYQAGYGEPSKLVLCCNNMDSDFTLEDITVTVRHELQHLFQDLASYTKYSQKGYKAPGDYEKSSYLLGDAFKTYKAIQEREKVDKKDTCWLQIIKEIEAYVSEKTVVAPPTSFTLDSIKSLVKGSCVPGHCTKTQFDALFSSRRSELDKVFAHSVSLFKGQFPQKPKLKAGTPSSTSPSGGGTFGFPPDPEPWDPAVDPVTGKRYP